MLHNLVKKAAYALIQWENACSIADVAKYYTLAYNYTQEAISLAGEVNKSVVFSAIAEKVLEIRVKKSEV